MSKKTLDEYHYFMNGAAGTEGTHNAQAAALLCIASAVEEAAEKMHGDSFGHQVCMGIRMALYGADASDHADLREGINELSKSLDAVADAIRPGASGEAR